MGTVNTRNDFVTFNNVYTLEQETVIKNEFKRLQGHYYLEHAGATLYSEKQISQACADLTSNLYANPHARSSPSKLTDDAIDQIRYEILKHFNTNTEEYTVIFTSSATHSLKILAESFQYSNEQNSQEKGVFAYLEDNHTSVLGMREFSDNVLPVPIDEALRIFSTDNCSGRNEHKDSNSLFVYPAQSNFSGTKYPLSWIKKVHGGAIGIYGKVPSKTWFCVLDAASYVSTNFLDLSIYKPDFVPLSFYKMFGFPTGLGALLVKNSSGHVLKKKYFGGGTVFLAMSSERIVVRRKVLHERFEDGSLPFLSILAIKYGFDTLKSLSLTMQSVSAHTFSLAQYVYQNLKAMRHRNGKLVAIIYSNTNFEDARSQGGIVNFNLLRENGDYVGYSEVLHFANLSNIHLRTGCFCNPGACKYHLKLTSEDVKYHFEQGHVCGDFNDLIDGYPTGSVRISFGYMSTKSDADALLNMIENCFITKPIIRKNLAYAQQINSVNELKENACSYRENKLKVLKNANGVNLENLNTNETGVKNNYANKGILQDIYLYPIKSCAHFPVKDEWELATTGLKYDRQWMIVNNNGVCLTQKQNSYLCLIKPVLDLETKKLVLHYDGLLPISIPFIQESHSKNIDLCQSKVCRDQIQGWDCGDHVADWLSRALNTPGVRLLKQIDNKGNDFTRISKKGEHVSLSLSNKAQFLLINTASVQWLLDRIPRDDLEETIEGLVNRFRPNFVVNFSEPFVEKQFQKFVVNNVTFEFDGNCTRCQMICIDQSTGEKSIEPLRTLSKEFGGKIMFGIYLRQSSNSSSVINVKCPIVGL